MLECFGNNYELLQCRIRLDLLLPANYHEYSCDRALCGSVGAYRAICMVDWKGLLPKQDFSLSSWL